MEKSLTYSTIIISCSRAKKEVNVITAMIFFIFILGCIMPLRCRAYIMPAEQVLGIMGANFSRFRTLVIKQSVKSEYRENNTETVVVQETIWLKSPDLYYSEIQNTVIEDRVDDEVMKNNSDVREHKSVSNPDVLDARIERKFIHPAIDLYFRQFFMADNENRIISLLNEMGIDIGRVSLTRLNGVISYCIGSGDAESPRLLIDKERFLPIFVSCRLQTDSGKRIVNAYFDDYRRLPEGWYPFEIVYSIDDSVMHKRCSVIDLKVNKPVEKSLSRIPELDAYSLQIFRNYQDESEEMHLNDSIEILKEKYR